MPTLTRWFLKTALLYLVAALALGVALAAPGALGVPPAWRVLAPTYLHLLVVGWVTQLIVGVSLWMFPRHSKARPRGPEGLGWTTFVGLNAGLLLRAVAEPLHALRPAAVPGLVLALSAALQWGAIVAYVASIWPRVKER